MNPLIAAVSVGGLSGTLLRFATAHWINANWPRHFYSATLAVNIAGCFMIGVLYGFFLIRSEVPFEVRSGLIVGFLGGLTTFSSFSMDTVRLLESEQVPLALCYAAVSVFGGLLATWVGLSLTKL